MMQTIFFSSSSGHYLACCRQWPIRLLTFSIDSARARGSCEGKENKGQLFSDLDEKKRRDMSSRVKWIREGRV